MATTQPLTDAITSLTTYANSVTGASDTTLSDAVRTLADGYGQGGGESFIFFTYTPTETTLSFDVPAGSFVLGNYYGVFAHSNNSENDPTYATIVDGGRFHMPYTNMGNPTADFGRITTRKKGSGTDYWNAAFITVTQNGQTLTIAGNANGYWMGGVEYSIYIQNINEWSSR